MEKVWKNKLEMWKIVCGIPIKEQGIIVLLQSLVDNKNSEKATLAAHDLNGDSGLDILIKKLDDVFKDEIVEDTYSIYLKFTHLKKHSTMSMNDYILEFENLSHEMSIHNMALPDTVLAFKILEGAMITDHQRQMTLTFASDLFFKRMKAALKRIFGEKSFTSTSNDELNSPHNIVKEEDAFYTSQRKYNRFNKNKYDKNIKTNPLTKESEISRCAIFDSKLHWAKHCQHRRIQNANIIETSEEEESQNEYEIEDLHFVLMTTQNLTKDFVEENKIKAVIDTACTKTVAGETWLENYMKNLDDTSLNQVEISESNKIFKFGDGRKVIATSKAKLPARIGNNKCFINAEIVKEKIPLLLSKTSLKKAGTVLNLKNDKIRMYNEDVDITTSYNGHYAISILPEENCNFNDIEQVLIFEEDETDKSKFPKIVKLHKQFGHASAKNLESLLKRAGITLNNITETINKVVSQCSTCKQYKKPMPRPAVELPRAYDFNDTVAMDLHQLGPNLWYLHLIDEFSRFSNAAIIKSKSSNVVIKMFLKYWISLFGTPNILFSDNGGEFVSKDFIDFCENFNMKVTTTAAEAPWSNGICERHNAIITDIILKVENDTNCDWETALAW